MPKAILIDNTEHIYSWKGKQVKRDVLRRDGSGKVAFVEIGNGTLHHIPAQEELEKEEFPISFLPLEEDDIIELDDE